MKVQIPSVTLAFPDPTPVNVNRILMNYGITTPVPAGGGPNGEITLNDYNNIIVPLINNAPYLNDYNYYELQLARLDDFKLNYANILYNQMGIDFTSKTTDAAKSSTKKIVKEYIISKLND